MIESVSTLERAMWLARFAVTQEKRPHNVTWWNQYGCYQVFPVWYTDGQYVWVGDTHDHEIIIWTEFPDVDRGR
jgi:hypothetical protein